MLLSGIAIKRKWMLNGVTNRKRIGSPLHHTLGFGRVNDMDIPSKHIIPCILPGLSCCEHRLIEPNRREDNVVRMMVWCGKWRENRMKDKVFRACDVFYTMPESK